MSVSGGSINFPTKGMHPITMPSRIPYACPHEVSNQNALKAFRNVFKQFKCDEHLPCSSGDCKRVSISLGFRSHRLEISQTTIVSNRDTR